MKTSLCFILFCALFLFTSCSVESITEEPLGDKNGTTELSLRNTESNSQKFSVTPVKLRKYLCTFRKDKEADIVEPIVKCGDTLAYYVQYADNKGWDLISADMRITPVLASCSHGSLEECNESSRNVAMGTLNHVSDIKQRAQLKKQSIWDFLEPSERISTKSSSERTSYRGIAEGMWLPLDTVFVYDTITTDRLITTKWGQRTPWDSYTPIDSAYAFYPHSAVGCGPVAAGQILYKYLYQTNGSHNTPDLVTFIGGRPQFVSFTSDWSGFALTTQNSTITEQEKTAKFLSWIGWQMNANYHFTQTSTTVTTLSNCLDNYLYFNEQSSYNCDTVINNLKDRIPVLVCALASEGGHAFIIDSYTDILYSYAERWIFDPYHQVTEEEYYSLPSWMFEWPSMGEFPSYDPEKEPAIKSNKVTLIDDTYILMNWGWSSISDDVIYLAKSRVYNYNYDYTVLYNLYDTEPSQISWPAGGYTFTNVFYMFSRFRNR